MILIFCFCKNKGIPGNWGSKVLQNNGIPVCCGSKGQFWRNAKHLRGHFKGPYYLFRIEGVDFFAEWHELDLLVAVDVLAKLVNVVDDGLKEIFNKVLPWFATTTWRWMKWATLNRAEVPLFTTVPFNTTNLNIVSTYNKYKAGFKRKLQLQRYSLRL